MLKKNKISQLCSFIFLGFSIAAGATTNPKSPIQFSGTPTSYSIGGSAMPIYPTASVTLPNGETVDFQLSGKGLRQKWLGIIKVNGYIGIHYLDNPTVLNAQDPIGSLSHARRRLMVLHMLQNVSPEDIRSEFDDALDVNGVNLNSPEMTSLREKTTYSLKSGERAYIVGYETNKDTFENIMVYAQGKLITERGTTLVTDVWKTWFGIPVDEEMAALKSSLLSNAVFFKN